MGNYDKQRAEREFNMNPPTTAPGQSDEWDALFTSSASTPTTDASGGTGADLDINSVLNGTANSQQPNTMMPGVGVQQPNQMNQNPQQSGYDSKLGMMVDDLAVKGLQGTGHFLKALFISFKNNTSRDWNMLGERICKVSIGVTAVGLLFFILSRMIPSLGDGLDLAIGGVFSEIVGVVLVTVNKKGTSTQQEIPMTMETPQMDMMPEEPSGIEWGEDDEDSSNDADDWGDFFGGDDEAPSSYSGEAVSIDSSFDPEQVAESAVNIPQGQYTRQFLFDTFIQVLPTVNPGFMDISSISENSDEFFMFEDYLKRSAEQTGINQDKLDELQLLEVRENLFLIQLVATRPTGLKENEIANGIADLFMRDNYGNVIEGREGVFAQVNSQVGKLLIDIFLSDPVMVSLGDVYRQKKDFILDTSNSMPLVWGVSEFGRVYCCDLMKEGNGGLLISGESRSGKSWKGQSLIAQMCMFRSPKELNLYFYDVKGRASDYAYLSKVLPHCKGFCGEALKFNDSIEALLNRESKRRTEILGGKYTNVKDYNRDHPYEKIPTIYIVVDEMATAMNEMKDKDVEIRKKFDSLLIQIATKYPYLEIKLLLFPHRIVNDIINKTVSSMISTRSVMGNVSSDELKNALDVRNFPYSLVKAGDMAIKSKLLNNGNTVYCHSEVLSKDEQINRKIFDYIGAVWKKLEPDCSCMGDSIFEPQRIPSRGGQSVNTANAGIRTVNEPARKAVAKDNSISATDFTYTGNSNVGAMTSADDFVANNDAEVADVDESFWDYEIAKRSGDVAPEQSESTEGSDTSDTEDSFWGNF